MVSLESLSSELDNALSSDFGSLIIDVSDNPNKSTGGVPLFLPPTSSTNPLHDDDNATVVPKHNLGNYSQSLPRLSSRERIQKYTTERFMSSESRALLKKFAGEKQLEDVHQEVEEEDKAETILKGLKAGMTGNNNPGGLWKRIEDDEGLGTKAEQQKVKKWVRIYEERVGKMYEKHRCRVGGGGIGRASEYNQDFSVEDFDIARLEQIDVEENYKTQRALQMMRTDSVRLDGLVTPGLQYEPKFTAPKRLPFGSKRNKYCEVCGLGCTVEPTIAPTSIATRASSPTTSDLGCSYCSAVYHSTCLTTPPPLDPSNFVCPDCVFEIGYSKKHYEKEKLVIYQHHLEQYYATLIIAKWRSRVCKTRYITMKRFLIRLQAMARAFKLRHSFKQMRRQKPRPLRVHIISGSNLCPSDYDNGLSDPYIIIAVLDEKDRQIWKWETDPQFDTLNPVFDYDCIIPGCPGTSKIVITVVDHDDNRHQALGQGYVHLNPRPTQETWKTGGTFRLDLDEVFYMPKTKEGVDMRLDCGNPLITPQGDILLEILPMDGIINNCGYLMGPPLDDEAINASYQKADLKRSRKCWALLAEHKLFVYSMFGLIKERLLLDLRHCHYSYCETQHLITLTSQKNGTEYAFSVPRHDERDRWRMAVECSFDLYINKRDPNSSERMASAIDLMKRRRGPPGTKSIKGAPNRKLKAGGKTGRRSRSNRSGSMHASAQSARADLKETLEINPEDVATPQGGEIGGFDALVTPTNHPSKRSTVDGNLGKDKLEPSNMTLKEFQTMKKSATQSSFFGEAGDGPPGTADLEQELRKGLKKGRTANEKARFPGLQRKASTSSALFGAVEHKQNAAPAKEFKFNKTKTKRSSK